MKNIFINGRFLTQKVTGEQRYAIEIVKALDEIIDKKKPENVRFYIIIPSDCEIVTKLKLKSVEIKKYGSGNGQKWTQIDYVTILKKYNGQSLTLCGLTPILNPGYWTVHDINFIKYPKSFSRSFIILYRIVFRLNVKRCKRIFTVSESAMNEISSYYGIPKNRFLITYNSCNLNNYCLDDGVLTKFGLKGKIFFLSVSSRNAHKNQKYIVELAKKYPQYIFVICGGQMNSFKTITEGQSFNLIYTGYVEDDELNALYKYSSGFIFPSFCEGFGIPALEAIMARCPRLALSNIDVFKELFNKDTYFFDPNDVNTFEIEDFLKIEISDKSRKFYQDKYSWEKSASIILNDIIEGR